MLSNICARSLVGMRIVDVKTVVRQTSTGSYVRCIEMLELEDGTRMAPFVVCGRDVAFFKASGCRNGKARDVDLIVLQWIEESSGEERTATQLCRDLSFPNYQVLRKSLDRFAESGSIVRREMSQGGRRFYFYRPARKR